MAIEIETGLEIPMPKKRGTYTPKYPFRAMKVGDSFFVPTDAPTKMHNNLSNCAKNQLGPKSVAIRTVEGGVRVWRIA